MKQMKILVIGENCKDIFVYGNAHRLAPEAPAPVFVPSKQVSNLGMAANVVENLKSLKVSTTFITNTNSIQKTRYVDDKTNHLLLRVDSGDSDTELTTEEFTVESLKKYDAVVISDYNKGFLNESKIRTICENHPRVFVDTKKLITEAFKDALFVKINKYEYELSISLIEEIQGFKERIIVTLGKEGCMLGDEYFPVSEVQVKDQVGAGDTFLAGLVYNYVKTKNIHMAIDFANECATKVVSKRGVVSI